MEILDAKIEVGSKKDCFEINNKFRYTCIDLMMLVNILENLFLLAIDYSDVFCSVVYIIFLFFFSVILNCPQTATSSFLCLINMKKWSAGTGGKLSLKQKENTKIDALTILVKLKKKLSIFKSYFRSFK